jgi:hypothetical protein
VSPTALLLLVIRGDTHRNLERGRFAACSLETLSVETFLPPFDTLLRVEELANGNAASMVGECVGGRLDLLGTKDSEHRVPAFASGLVPWQRPTAFSHPLWVVCFVLRAAAAGWRVAGSG